MSYVAERRWDDWITEVQFAIEVTADEEERVYQYPNDPHLRGLSRAASPLDAHKLINEYVMSTRAVHVDPVRYRPGRRAVLRHVVGVNKSNRVTFFARVMRPKDVERLISAAELTAHSGFILPRLAGVWPEGGVVWLSRIPGKTVRDLIRSGRAPEPSLILNAVSGLWAAPVAPNSGQSLNIKDAFRRDRRLFRQILQTEEAQRTLELTTDALDSFVKSWQPSGLAHNDFYDDQMLLTPKGELAMVDFEETGPGDAMMDIGNMLAHLRWASRSGKNTEKTESYHRLFRSAALEQFGWNEQDLNMREAFTLFRTCTNPIRHLSRDWPDTIEKGLALVRDVIEGKP